jgi:predicted small metal-binding protein
MCHGERLRYLATVDQRATMSTPMAQPGKDPGAIELVVRCDCGFETRGVEDDVVPIVQRHGIDAHNMKATREQVLAMARPA